MRTTTSRAPTESPGLMALATAMAFGVFLVDLQTPLGVAIGALYIVVVLLGLIARGDRFPVAAAAVTTALTLVGGWLSPTPGSVSHGVINRSLILLVIWATAVLVRQYKQVERELREETRRAQGYLDVAGVILVVLDRDGVVTLINPMGCKVLGYEEEEIVGTNWLERFIPERMRDELRGVHARITGLGQDESYFENPVVTRSGEERLIAWHNRALRDDDGRIVGTLSSGEDVTERRQAEERLQASIKDLADLKLAIDQASIVAITDVGGTIRYANDKFCEISKYAREELLGQDHRIVNSGYHSKEFFRDLWRTIGSGQIWRGEIRNRAKDGAYYWVDTTIVPFLDERGKPYQYMALRTDITERKRAEVLLRERTALARLGEMAAIVAHEVKNPLAGIRGALQVIGTRLPPASRERAVLGDIQDRLDTLNELLQDLLLFARPKEPKTSLVQLTALIEDTTALFKRDPQSSDIAISVNGDTAVVQVDAAQIQRAFLNLLLNAAQAMGGRGQIDVQVAAGDGQCEVSFLDHGPGIPPDVLVRVFEPFFTTKYRGTGLGLPTAKQIVERHGGTLAVSCPPGGGTLVVVRLPIAA